MNKKIKKRKKAEYIEHCLLCDKCLYPEHNNCQGLDS